MTPIAHARMLCGATDPRVDTPDFYPSRSGQDRAGGQNGQQDNNSNNKGLALLLSRSLSFLRAGCASSKYSLLVLFRAQAAEAEADRVEEQGMG